MVTLTCIECSKSFEAQRSSAKFCSPNCRVKFNKRGGAKNDPKNGTDLGAEKLPLNRTDLVPEIPPENQVKIPEETTPEKTVQKEAKTSTKKEAKKADESLGGRDESWAGVIALNKRLNDKYGPGTSMFLGDKPLKFDGISTGSLGLDLAIGGQGLPKGRVIEMFGPESSGKTTLATHVIAEAQKTGGKCVLIDAEHAFDPNYARLMGVNVEDLIITQPECGEDALQLARQYIESGNFSVVVIDSVAALVPKGEHEGEMGDSKMGLQARLMSQALRIMCGMIHRTKTVCIFINQLRDKIGVVWGSPEVTTGGNALKFYASVRLDIRKIGQIKDGETVIGNKVKVRIVKNKVAPPFKTAEFDLIFGKGINKEGDIVDLAIQYGFITKNSSWYSYNGAYLGQGRTATCEVLEANPELCLELVGKIKEAFNK